MPSPLAVAPFALEARLRYIWTRRSRVWPAPNEAVKPRGAEAVAAGHELVRARHDPERATERCRRVGVGDRRDASLVAPDEQLHRLPLRLPSRRERDRGLVREGRLEAGHGIGVVRPARGRALAEAPAGEHVPEEVLVGAAEADQVRGEHRVAGVEHADRPVGHQQPARRTRAAPSGGCPGRPWRAARRVRRPAAAPGCRVP